MDKIKLEDRIIVMCEDVDESSVKSLLEKIMEINAKDDDWYREFQIMGLPGKREDVVPPIRIILSTFGGDVDTGLGLYDIIRTSTTPVHIECNGKIMSMGIILALASEYRVAHKHTTFMIHQLKYWEYDKIQDQEERLVQAKQLDAEMVNIITENTTIKAERIQEVWEKKQNWYLTAEEALECGLIKAII